MRVAMDDLFEVLGGDIASNADRGIGLLGSYQYNVAFSTMTSPSASLFRI